MQVFRKYLYNEKCSDLKSYTAEGVAQSVYVDTVSCSTVGFDRLVESQEGLDTEVGSRADLPHCCITCSFKIGHRDALMCLDSLRLPGCVRNPHISLERSGVPRATEVLGQEFLDQISPEGHRIMFYLFRLESSCGTYKLVPRGTQMPYSAAVDLVAGLGASQMAYPSHRWTYREGTLVDEPSRTTSSSSSSYSLKEIIPEREPIPVIDISDDESVEGPEMAPVVAPRIGPGTSIEEDPSEPTSDSKMTPEPE
ncbi:hypothetical protein M9H77_11629 [Catharanthus roseus]|uniref:Uncharacterized protein n=1 Tax=Catharanthus roseus TaxID=4058 RepID=A0ACC0BF67_CATRO|nr:hypothetical protein M9H77_11629 [Catharanthus roseus]